MQTIKGAEKISEERDPGVDLYWLPLGAGGRFVRLNGRLYEYFHARYERRPRRDLYHTALEVIVSRGTYVIESAWPIPDSNPIARGVTVEGPVWTRHLGRLRVFRYEVRRWPDGSIADVNQAVASPQRLGGEAEGNEVLNLAEFVPTEVWGRVILQLGEMWNSNSVISWLLTSAGINGRAIEPPPGGRAPGWMSGVLLAERNLAAVERQSHLMHC